MVLEQHTDIDTDDPVSAARTRRERHPIAQFAQHPKATTIMQVLVDAGGQDLGVSTICDHAGISRDTWYNCREMLLDYGLVEHTRDENGGPLYRARMESDVVTAWQTFRAALRDEANGRV